MLCIDLRISISSRNWLKQAIDPKRRLLTGGPSCQYFDPVPARL
jgi:hypothetical protein